MEQAAREIAQWLTQEFYSRIKSLRSRTRWRNEIEQKKQNRKDQEAYPIMVEASDGGYILTCYVTGITDRMDQDPRLDSGQAFAFMQAMLTAYKAQSQS